MNFNFYIFGTLQGKYSQYPNDYISSTISPQQSCVEGSRLTIVRKNDLIHYIFTERIDKTSTIGLCLVFNKARLNKPKHLIELFQYIIETRMVERGSIIKYDNSGHLFFTVNSIAECSVDYERLQEYVNDELETNSHKYGIEPLKTIYDGTNTSTTVDQGASDARIVQLTTTYNTVVVNLGEGIKHGYIEQIMDSLNNTNTLLANENAILKENIEHLSKQKKQYKLVIALVVAMFVGALIFIAVISDKNTKIKEQLTTIQNNEETISSQGNTISTQNNTISEQKQTISTLNNKVNELESKYNSLESDYSNITSTYPLKITNIEIGNTYSNDQIETDYGYTIYSSRTMYLKPKIYYVGYNSGSYNFKVKWYTPSGAISRGSGSPSGYSQSQNIYVYSGQNEETLRGWGNSTKGQWPSGTYRIEIWYNNMCLKSKTFTIY